jgi:hypothetical protein
VVLLCLAALMMLVTEESPSFALRAAWIPLLGVGLLLYIWGRFFSRGEP